MKMCQPHWEALRKAIDDRGLSHLVAKGGEQAARNLVAETREGPSLQTFDPLMAAHNAIFGNAMQLTGLELMRGDRCPICFVNEEAPKHGQAPTFADGWVDLAADGAKQQAEALLGKAKPDA